MKNGTILTATITGLSLDGLGTARVDDYEIRVPGAAVGDCVKVTVNATSNHHKTAWTTVKEVISRGQHYVRPDCHHPAQFRGSCGGCPLMHLAPVAQLELKSRVVAEALKDFDVGDVTIHAAEQQVGYRNRSNYVVTRVKWGGQVRLGSYEPRGHKVARMDECRVVRPAIAAVATALEAIITDDRGIALYEDDQKGLRYVTIRSNDRGDVLLELIVGDGDQTAKFLVRKASKIKGVRGICVSINSGKGNAIRQSQAQGSWGSETISERVGSLQLDVSASVFSQLNSDVAATMYARAAQWAEHNHGIVWDLYCGIGGLGLTIAAHFPDVRLFGAESVEESVTLARRNAKRSKSDAHFRSCDLSQGLPPNWPDPTVIVVNPPRKGLAPAIIAGLIQQRCPIIYMSCNPTSFARDLTQLRAGGYRLETLEAFDMLPHTAHVELLGRLVKEESVDEA